MTLFDPVPRLGCGLAGLESLGPGSVGLVLSDLPSGETSAPHDVVPDLARFWAATWAALRPGGNAVLMASSIRFAARLIESETARFRYDLVWSKSVATGFLNAAQRPLRSHEFVLVFWRERERGTYHPQMRETGVPISANTRGALAPGALAAPRREYAGTNYGRGTSGTRSRAGATTRFPTSTLSFGSVPSRSKQRRHHQQKPVPLLRYLVETYSDPGELVVDPFAGSASTGAACRDAGRTWIGWDTNPDHGVPERDMGGLLRTHDAR